MTSLKIGDQVKIASGTGKIVWMKPRKIPQGNNLNLPLVDGPDWDIGVMIRNPPDSPFPFYIYCAHAERAILIEEKKIK